MSEGGVFCFIFPEIQINEDIHYEENQPFSDDIPLKLSAVAKQSEITLQNLSTWKVGDFLPIGIEKMQKYLYYVKTNRYLEPLWGKKIIISLSK